MRDAGLASRAATPSSPAIQEAPHRPQYLVSIAHEHPMVCTVNLEDGAVFDLSAKLLARVAVDAVESANHVLPRRRVLAVGALPRLELSD